LRSVSELRRVVSDGNVVSFQGLESEFSLAEVVSPALAAARSADSANGLAATLLGNAFARVCYML